MKLGTFYPKTIKGINPSKDGNFYTSIEQDKSKTEIVKYDYKTNKKVATLFSNISFNNFEFSDYKWIRFCTNHCWKQKVHRRKSNLICKKCGSPVRYQQNI